MCVGGGDVVCVNAQLQQETLGSPRGGPLETRYSVVSRFSSGSHILCNRPGNTYTCLQLGFRGHNSVKKTVLFFQKTKTCHPAGVSTAVLSIKS